MIDSAKAIQFTYKYDTACKHGSIKDIILHNSDMVITTGARQGPCLVPKIFAKQVL